MGNIGRTGRSTTTWAHTHEKDPKENGWADRKPTFFLLFLLPLPTLICIPTSGRNPPFSLFFFSFPPHFLDQRSLSFLSPRVSERGKPEEEFFLQGQGKKKKIGTTEEGERKKRGERQRERKEAEGGRKEGKGRNSLTKRGEKKRSRRRYCIDRKKRNSR